MSFRSQFAIIKSLFKYLPSKYGETFVERGELLFRSLSYFRNYEELKVRGDLHEGQRLYTPLNGLEISNLTTGEKINLPWSFTSSVQDREIFVFCLSQEYSSELAREFKTDICIEIHNPVALLAKVRKALMLRQWVENARLLSGNVDYYAPQSPPLAEWTVPERMIFKKTDNFSFQKEYRLAFAKGNALHLNNVSTQIYSNTKENVPTIIDHPMHTLRLGTLRRLCSIHLI